MHSTYANTHMWIQTSHDINTVLALSNARIITCPAIYAMSCHHLYEVTPIPLRSKLLSLTITIACAAFIHNCMNSFQD
jgi:hypothetical protein